MPQMAPMNWTLLFTMVVIMFITVKALIYFNFTPNLHLTPSTSNSESTYTKINQLNWKW